MSEKTIQAAPEPKAAIQAAPAPQTPAAAPFQTFWEGGEGILGDGTLPLLSHPTGVRPRTAIYRQIQSRRGNAYVQRLMREQESEQQSLIEPAVRALNDHSAGQPLDSSSAHEFGGSLGHPLDSVRVHSDTHAAGLAQDLNATAFTRGQDVYFSQGAYRPDTSAGRTLLAHELVHTVQQSEPAQTVSTSPTAGLVSEPDDPAEQQAEHFAQSVTPNLTQPIAPASRPIARQVAAAPPPPDVAAVNASVDVIISKLRGITTRWGSAAILREFQGKSAATVRAILQELKNRGPQNSLSADGMIDWLFGDMTSEDRRDLRRLLASLGVTDDLARIVAGEIKNLLDGYTSEADSQKIYAAFMEVGVVGIDQVLTQLEQLARKNRDEMADWLFNDMDRTNAENVRQLFFRVGGSKALLYAAWFTAYKIESLLAGYTGHADSSSIVWNLERTPVILRPVVMTILDLRTRQRWRQSAEDALMSDMDRSDYEQLRTGLGIALRPYDRQPNILSRALGYAEWSEIALEVIVGGIIGIITGVLSVLWDLVVLAWDIAVASYNLFMSFMYLLSQGIVGSAEWLATKDFFRGFGELFSNPGRIMQQAWDEVKLSSSTIEGVFEYGRRAEFWTRRVVNIIVNILLIAAAGYGAVKGAVGAVAEVAELAETVGTLRAVGTVARRALRSVGQLVEISAARATSLLSALRQPLQLLGEIRQTLNVIIALARDEELWRGVRAQLSPTAIRQAAGERLAAERDWWQRNREFWEARARAQQVRELELSAEANSLENNLNQNRAPDQANGQIQGIQQDATQLKNEANDLNRQVTADPGQPQQAPPQTAQPQPGQAGPTAQQPQPVAQAQPAAQGQAAPPPVVPVATPRVPSRQSLLQFLEDIWQRQAAILQRGREIEAGNAARIASKLEPIEPSRAVYSQYARAVEPNPLTRNPDDYLQDLSRLAENRPLGARSTTQGAYGQAGDIRYIPEVVEDAGGAGFDRSRIGRDFFRYERANADLGAVRERVYLNVNADRATQVMEMIVRGIIDNEAQFAGVELAKISGPGSVSRRGDAIVIYCRDQAAANRVLARLEEIQTANPEYFRSSTPPITNRVAPGISVGSEPLGSGGKESFGGVRSDAIYSALLESVNANETREQFIQRALDRLRARGVDPDIPHRNLAPGAAVIPAAGAVGVGNATTNAPRGNGQGQ